MAYDSFMTNGLTYMRKVTSREATKQFAQTLAPYLQANDVVVLKGDLGAGKTQFVQAVADAMGVPVQVTSPTFNILLVYEGTTLPLCHFDWYRLEKESELEDIAYYDLIEAGGVTFIEWGDKFPSALPCEYVEIDITVEADEIRVIRVHAYGERARRLLVLWASDSKSRLSKV